MTAKLIKLILVIVMVASLTGCLMGTVLFLNTAEEVPADNGDVMYEVHELPESGTIIAFPKKPVEERGAN